MIGAIAGDVIGSIHEGAQPMAKDFPLFQSDSRFTDDTVLTVAVAHAIRSGGSYAESLRAWSRRYPSAGYGVGFIRWFAADHAGPYNSYGNGSAMRVSPVAWAYDDLDRVLDEARRSAEVTHSHSEGVKGAQAIAAVVRVARTGGSRDDIRQLLEDRFGYDCSATVAEVQRRGGFDITCQGTVPAAAVAFLESTDFEDAVRNAVSFGGDADTLACIAGAMAEGFYGGVPEHIQREVVRRLDAPLREELAAFCRTYGIALLFPTAEPC